MEIINLSEYKVVKDENNFLILENGMVLLENLRTGDIVKGDYEQVKNTIDRTSTNGAVYLEMEYEEENEEEIIALDNSLIPDCLVTPGRVTKKSGSEIITTLSLPISTYFPKIGTLPTSKPQSVIFSEPSASHADNLSSPEPESTGTKCSSEPATDSDNYTDSEQETPPVPKKRIRKSAHEIFCEKLLAAKEEKMKKIEQLFQEKAAKQEQRNKEKIELKNKRHQEKLQMLEQLIKSQRKY